MNDSLLPERQRAGPRSRRPDDPLSPDDLAVDLIEAQRRDFLGVFAWVCGAALVAVAVVCSLAYFGGVR